MQSLWTDFVAALRQPEYVHLLLNPLPIYGLAAGFCSLVVALITRSRGGQAIALLLIFLTAAAAWPVAHYGSAGYDRIYAMSTGPAQQWLNWHAYLADRIVWSYYTAAALAVLTLLGQWKFSRLHCPALIFTLLATMTSLGLGGFLAFVGGKIRHSEFRHESPPAWAHTTADED